jgi:hypothetical protein
MSRLPEYAVVRTLVGHSDMEGRLVPAGVIGTVVHSYALQDSVSPGGRLRSTFWTGWPCAW